MTIGPEYANRYYRLCHLHFRVEMLRNIEGRIYLSKEAVPSIFLKPLQTGKLVNIYRYISVRPDMYIQLYIIIILLQK